MLLTLACDGGSCMRPVVDILHSADRHINLLSTLVTDISGRLTYDCGMHYWSGSGAITPIHTNVLEEMRDDEIIRYSEGRFIELFLPVRFLAAGNDPRNTIDTVWSPHMGNIESPTYGGLGLLSLCAGFRNVLPCDWRTYDSDPRWQIP